MRFAGRLVVHFWNSQRSSVEVFAFTVVTRTQPSAGSEAAPILGCQRT